MINFNLEDLLTVVAERLISYGDVLLVMNRVHHEEADDTHLKICSQLLTKNLSTI